MLLGASDIPPPSPHPKEEGEKMVAKRKSKRRGWKDENQYTAGWLVIASRPSVEASCGTNLGSDPALSTFTTKKI